MGAVVPRSGRCRATVHRRDTYRRTGRGKSGFELHYQRGQCKRARGRYDLCTQHQKMEASGCCLVRWD